MDANLQVILQQLQAEKGIDRETLVEAIRGAIESAAKKSFTHGANIAVEVDERDISFKVFEIRDVVEQVADDSREISISAAKKLNAEVKVGDRLKVPAEPKDFGRIAAQTAKQVIIQKIKDAERDSVYDEFKQREGDLVTGTVKRVAHGNIIVSIGKAEAIVPIREQSPREVFKVGDRLRAYLLEVEKSAKGPQVVLSRTTKELVRGLFELEVPEIYDGTIDIRAIAREPGSRTKIAVHSNDPNVDAVGACVGMKGSRVRAVVEELNGEKIDIVRWSPDPVEFCGNALNPADILDITVDEENKSILVIVPHDQLSLAIGKRGQNARLASRLIGWNIDIKSDVELSEASNAIEAAEAALSGLTMDSADEHGSAALGVQADAAEPDSGPSLETGDAAAVAEAGASQAIPAVDSEAAGELPEEDRPEDEVPVDEAAREEPSAKAAPAEDTPAEVSSGQTGGHAGNALGAPGQEPGASTMR